MNEPCTAPAPFPLDPTVCSCCGILLADHRSIGDPPQDVDRLLWGVIIRLGGIYDYYSGELCGQKNPAFRTHMESCSPDWANTGVPEVDSVSRFTDSFHKPDELEAMGGMLSCSCGEYRYETIQVRSLTRGQLLWHALQADGRS